MFIFFRRTQTRRFLQAIRQIHAQWRKLPCRRCRDTICDSRVYQVFSSALLGVRAFNRPFWRRQGTVITQNRFGANDVWIKELRSGELMLLWKNFTGATSYTVEDQELPDGLMHRVMSCFTCSAVFLRWLYLWDLCLYTKSVTFASKHNILPSIHSSDGQNRVPRSVVLRLFRLHPKSEFY